MECPHTNRRCGNPLGMGLCEFCSVPSAFGWRSYYKRGKWLWERLWISDKERSSRMVGIRRQIDILLKQADSLYSIPSKEDYLKMQEDD